MDSYNKIVYGHMEAIAMAYTAQLGSWHARDYFRDRWDGYRIMLRERGFDTSIVDEALWKEDRAIEVLKDSLSQCKMGLRGGRAVDRRSSDRGSSERGSSERGSSEWGSSERGSSDGERNGIGDEKKAKNGDVFEQGSIYWAKKVFQIKREQETKVVYGDTEMIMLDGRWRLMFGNGRMVPD